MAEKTTRLFSLDFLRIIAICAVIMIHISADFITDYDKSTTDFVLGNIFNSISRFAVPVFFMISGALMLDETKDVSNKKIIKSVFTFLLLTFSWSLIYTILYNIIKPIIFSEAIVITDILDTFFNGHYHMWYLYALIGLYAITPLLRCFIKKENSALIRNYLIFSIAICFLTSFINAICNMFLSSEDVVSNFFDNFNFKCFHEYVIYYVLGWYVVNVGFQKTSRIALYISALPSLIATFVLFQNSYPQDGANYFHENNSLNMFFYSLAVFVFIYYTFKEKNIVLKPFWIKISNLTFGVYLIHCIYLFFFKMLFGGLSSSLLKIIIIFVGSVLLSFVTVFIMSKIPLLKKLVRG